MRCHDFHLSSYEVRQFGAEIVLHLLDDYPPRPAEWSHIRFADVELYHFLHTGGAIIFGIDEAPLVEILDEFWDRMREWYRQHGGIPHWDDDRARYQDKLQTEGYRTWRISSSIGFAGFVIAKSIEDITDQFAPTA